MAITLGDAFQNWNPDTKLATGGAKVDGGVIAMLEPNIFRNKVMLPGVTFATDVESLMVDNKFAVAFIRKLDKVKVTLTKATADGAFRVVPTQSDGDFIEVKCNDVLKVAEVVNEPIDDARVSGELRRNQRTALPFVPYQRRRLARRNGRGRTRVGEHDEKHERQHSRQHYRRQGNAPQGGRRPRHADYFRRYRRCIFEVYRRTQLLQRCKRKRNRRVRSGVRGYAFQRQGSRVHFERGRSGQQHPRRQGSGRHRVGLEQNRIHFVRP